MLWSDNKRVRGTSADFVFLCNCHIMIQDCVKHFSNISLTRSWQRLLAGHGSRRINIFLWAFLNSARFHTTDWKSIWATSSAMKQTSCVSATVTPGSGWWVILISHPVNNPLSQFWSFGSINECSSCKYFGIKLLNLPVVVKKNSLFVPSLI